MQAWQKEQVRNILRSGRKAPRSACTGRIPFCPHEDLERRLRAVKGDIRRDPGLPNMTLTEILSMFCEEAMGK